MTHLERFRHIEKAFKKNESFARSGYDILDTSTSASRRDEKIFFLKAFNMMRDIAISSAYWEGRSPQEVDREFEKRMETQ